MLYNIFHMHCTREAHCRELVHKPLFILCVLDFGIGVA